MVKCINCKTFVSIYDYEENAFSCEICRCLTLCRKCALSDTILYKYFSTYNYINICLECYQKL